MSPRNVGVSPDKGNQYTAWRRRYIFAGDFWEMRVDFIPRIDQGSALAVEVALRLLLSGPL